MIKESFLMYHTWKPLFGKLGNERAGKLLLTIFDFSTDGIEPEEGTLDGEQQMLYLVVRDALIRNNQKYLETCRKRKEAAQKRWEKDHPGEFFKEQEFLSEAEREESYRKRMLYSEKKAESNMQMHAKDADNEHDNEKDKEQEHVYEHELVLEREKEKGIGEKERGTLLFPAEVQSVLDEWEQIVDFSESEQQQNRKDISEKLKAYGEPTVVSMICNAKDRQNRWI